MHVNAFKARVWEAGCELTGDLVILRPIRHWRLTHFQVRLVTRNGELGETCARGTKASQHWLLIQLEILFLDEAHRTRPALAVGFVGATSAGKSWLAGSSAYLSWKMLESTAF